MEDAVTINHEIPNHRPVLIAGREPLLPGIGYDVNGFIERAYGQKLQYAHLAAYEKNIDFIADHESATVVIPPVPNDTNQVNKMFGGVYSEAPELKAEKANYVLPTGDNQQVAFYPQDCFTQMGNTVIFKDSYSRQYFSELLPAGNEVMVHKDLGEGGKIVRGQSLIFYSSAAPLTSAESVLLTKSTGKIPFRIASPLKLGMEDPSRAVKLDHIDQVIGFDLIVTAKKGPYIAVPIDEDYFAKLQETNQLPAEVTGTNGKRMKVEYIKIRKNILNMIDLLNCPTTAKNYYIGPLLAKIVSLYIDAQENSHSLPEQIVSSFQDELLKMVKPFPEQINKRNEATAETKLMFQQAEFYHSIYENFDRWGREADDILKIHTSGIRILPGDTPSTTKFKAGTKCKMNLVS